MSCASLCYYLLTRVLALLRAGRPQRRAPTAGHSGGAAATLTLALALAQVLTLALTLALTLTLTLALALALTPNPSPKQVGLRRQLLRRAEQNHLDAALCYENHPGPGGVPACAAVLAEA